MSKVQVKDLARRMAAEAGFGPDEIVQDGAFLKPHPRWTAYVKAAQDRVAGRMAAEPIPAQAAEYRDAPLAVFGVHDPGTLEQMRACMGIGGLEPSKKLLRERRSLCRSGRVQRA